MRDPARRRRRRRKGSSPGLTVVALHATVHVPAVSGPAACMDCIGPARNECSCPRCKRWRPMTPLPARYAPARRKNPSRRLSPFSSAHRRARAGRRFSVAAVRETPPRPARSFVESLLPSAPRPSPAQSLAAVQWSCSRRALFWYSTSSDGPAAPDCRPPRSLAPLRKGRKHAPPEALPDSQSASWLEESLVWPVHELRPPQSARRLLSGSHRLPGAGPFLVLESG